MEITSKNKIRIVFFWFSTQTQKPRILSLVWVKNIEGLVFGWVRLAVISKSVAITKQILLL